MEKVLCRICGSRHNAWESHKFTKVTADEKVETVIVPKSRNSGTRHCPTCRCEGKRVYDSAAERQRAYRERNAVKG